MRINAGALMSRIESDRAAVHVQLAAARNQEAALSSLAANTEMGDSLAYARLRSYIEELRLPAAMLRSDFLMALAGDLETDRARGSAAFEGLGGQIDTDRLQAAIDNRRRAAALCAFIRLEPHVGMLAGAQLSHQEEMYRRQAGELQDKLERVLAYINDSSIYATSLGYAGRLRSAASSLDRATFDEGQLAYNLSGIDLSWRSDASTAEYWRERNRLMLSRYLELDENGIPTGIKDPMRVAELIGFALGYVADGRTLSDALTELTPEEKYFVTWFLCVAAPQIYEMEYGIATDVTSGLPELPEGVVAALGGLAQGRHVPGVSDLLSFTADGGMVYDLNVPGSIQQRSGFSDLVELAGPMLGMDLDTQIVTFVYEGQEYRLQTWDGSYAAGAAWGGEVALYSRPAPDESGIPYKEMSPAEVRANIETLTPEQLESLWITYDTVTGDDLMDIDITVSNGTETTLRRIAEGTYWNFTAVPLPPEGIVHRGTGYRKDDLSVESTLTFKNNPGLADAAIRALESRGYEIKRISIESFEVTWGEP